MSDFDKYYGQTMNRRRSGQPPANQPRHVQSKQKKVDDNVQYLVNHMNAISDKIGVIENLLERLRKLNKPAADHMQFELVSLLQGMVDKFFVKPGASEEKSPAVNIEPAEAEETSAEAVEEVKVVKSDEKPARRKPASRKTTKGRPRKN